MVNTMVVELKTLIIIIIIILKHADFTTNKNDLLTKH